MPLAMQSKSSPQANGFSGTQVGIGCNVSHMKRRCSRRSSSRRAGRCRRGRSTRPGCSRRVAAIHGVGPATARTVAAGATSAGAIAAHAAGDASMSVRQTASPVQPTSGRSRRDTGCRYRKPRRRCSRPDRCSFRSCFPDVALAVAAVAPATVVTVVVRPEGASAEDDPAGESQGAKERGVLGRCKASHGLAAG